MRQALSSAFPRSFIRTHDRNRVACEPGEALHKAGCLLAIQVTTKMLLGSADSGAPEEQVVHRVNSVRRTVAVPVTSPCIRYTPGILRHPSFPSFHSRPSVQSVPPDRMTPTGRRNRAHAGTEDSPDTSSPVRRDLAPRNLPDNGDTTRPHYWPQRRLWPPVDSRQLQQPGEPRPRARCERSARSDPLPLRSLRQSNLTRRPERTLPGSTTASTSYAT